MKKSPFYCLVIFAGICFMACKKPKSDCDPKTQNVVYTLNDDTLVLPYSGRDSLWFEKHDASGNVTDTVLFIGQGKVVTTYIYTEPGECPVTYSSQDYRICYLSAMGNDSFVVSFAGQSKYMYAGIHFSYEGNEYRTMPAYIRGDAKYPNTYPSLTLNGRTYLDAIMIPPAHPPTGSNFAFVNKHQGLLQMVSWHDPVITFLKK